MTAVFWRAFLVAGLVLGMFVYGCGRTTLDDGFGAAGNSGSAGATGMGGQVGNGAGGRAGGGQGGVGVGTPVICGNTTCVAGMQSCCTHLVAGQIAENCVSSGDPMACSDGVVGCTGSVVCPVTGPKCCQVMGDVGLCLPAKTPCTPLGP
jgi:hypothetical protein